MKDMIIGIDPASKDGDKSIETRGYIEDGKLTITSIKEVKSKDIRIRSNEELESQIQTLKEYYGVKSKSGAIKKAVKDTSMVAEYKSNNL